jgi:hypothetical protein
MNSTKVKMVINVRKAGGNAPNWKSTFTKVQFDEDNSTTVNLDDFVTDIDPVDDDALVYDVTGYSDNLTVTKTDRNHYAFSAKADWNGEVTGVKVMVTDTFGLSDNVTIKVVVNPLNDPPREVKASTSPATGGPTIIYVDEGQTQNFTVGAEDPDGNVTMIYEWYLDDNVISNAVTETYAYSPGFEDSGTHMMKAIVKDEVNPALNFNVSWTVQVGNINRKPTNVKIVSPEHNKTYKQGAKLEFNAEQASDPDGDTVTYTWYTDDTPMPGGGNRTFVYKKLKPGTHVIKLEVSDGKGGLVTDEITIKIKKKKETPGFEMVFVLLALLAVGLLYQRKRR